MLGDGAFDDAGAGAGTAIGEQVAQHGAADPAGQVDGGLGDHAGGLDDLVAGGVQGDGEAAAVGWGVGPGEGGVGDGGAQGLVGDQEGVDLLVDAIGGSGPQDAPAEDGGFQFQVGRFDLPPLVVERDQVGGVAAVSGQRADRPVAADPAGPARAAHHDLGVDHAHGDGADAGQPASVAAAVDGRQSPVVLAADEQVGAGGGFFFYWLVGGGVLVSFHKRRRSGSVTYA